MPENKEAEKILLEVLNVINKLLLEGIDESYINYVLFRFTGNAIKEQLGESKIKELFKNEIIGG